MLNQSLRDAFKKATENKENKGLTKLVNDIAARPPRKYFDKNKERRNKNEESEKSRS